MIASTPGEHRFNAAREIGNKNLYWYRDRPDLTADEAQALYTENQLFALQTFCTIMKTDTDEHKFRAGIAALDFDTISPEDKTFACELLLKTDPEHRRCWLDAMDAVLAKGNDDDKAMSEVLLASKRQHDEISYESKEVEEPEEESY